MSKPLCIITEADFVPQDVILRLEARFDISRGPFTRAELAQAIKGASGLYIGLDHKIEGDLMPQGLKFIASPTTGLNHIDLNQAAKQGIEIISLKGEAEFLSGITATAELCWGLILSLTRFIPAAQAHVLKGGWDRDAFTAHELQGRTIGIIGFGRLGKKIATYAKAFDMRVLACDTSGETRAIDGVQFCALKDLLPKADIISLHADSRAENHHMIGANEFAAMKKGGMFINTARGDLVDEAALLATLQSGHLGGAALDVLEGEYDPSRPQSPLIDYARDNRNLIMTPHIGGVTHESLYKTTHFTAEKLLRWWDARRA